MSETFQPRTDAEILRRISAVAKRDVFGFEQNDLVGYLSFEAAKPFLIDGVTSEQWKPRPRDRESIIAEIRDYMPFAIGKAVGERGLSASRSISHMEAWLWMLRDDETLAFAEADRHFAPYGAPILARIANRYGCDASELEALK